MPNYGLNEKQQDFIKENRKKLKETELFEKISEIGPAPVLEDFGKFIKELTAKEKDDVFKEVVSPSELAAASGGECGYHGQILVPDSPFYTCDRVTRRWIYDGRFPNCAATVRDGSWCDMSDACYRSAIVYSDLRECDKSWK